MCSSCDSDSEMDNTDEFGFTVEQVVAAGMAYLDMRYPDHADRVSLNTLNQSNTFDCALAQAAQMEYLDALYEDQDNIPQNRTERNEWARNHGFDTDGYNGPTYNELTREWRKQYDLRKIAKLLETVN